MGKKEKENPLRSLANIVSKSVIDNYKASDELLNLSKLCLACLIMGINLYVVRIK